MSRKMIFFDIDGTIISEDTHMIAEGTIKAIRKARENGHLTFINTGRTFFNVPEEIRSIGFDGYICGCGTYIYYNGKELLAKSISHEKCKEIIEKLRGCKIQALCEGLDGVYFDETRPETSELANIKEGFRKGGHDISRNWDEPNIVFDKFVVWTDEESDYDAFYAYITKDFDYIDRGNNFGEIVPKGYSKATGIKFLQEYLNVDLEDCYAIGDSTNDLPMLEYVPNSILMGNGTKSLFGSVAFVTKNIDDNGIEYALKHYNII
ncbi:HAD family hydrolase [Clostridium oryzae]|uniref:Putative bifunctional phosphatase/peptidyl-prolyl cis-trans isomerase n=1 Tax=Clostridium oryzae TaxID=1450648 RepID=A0A1V4IIP4_9CLOT|nr:HAD family hydrolase [Clostridium oryzae]OPJ59720.1 putative bifunctional phosphatase/peptidyl-prolyl cis-trans isomerase [Clostridium oryzae]